MKLGRNKHQGQAQIDWINAKLEYSEKSGFTIDSKEHILKQSKSLLYDFNPNSENIISDHNWSNKMKKWKTFAKRIVINKSMETVYYESLKR